MDYEIVKIGTKKMPVKFGFNALRQYSNITGTTLQDLNKLGVDMTLDNAITLVYCGVKDGARAAKQSFNLDIDDIADMMDGNIDSLGKIFDVLGKHMSNGLEEKKPKANKIAK